MFPVIISSSTNRHSKNGKVAEWSNAPDSKSGIRLYRIVGSNPTLSARIRFLKVRQNIENPHETWGLAGFFVHFVQMFSHYSF